MATAQTLINSALRKLGALGVGETPNATESAECLTALNQLLGSLNTEPGLIWAEQAITKAITASTSSMTIGTAGTWAVARPIRIISAQWVDSSGTVYDITPNVPLDEFLRLSKVATTGTPTILNYEAAVASGTLQWYPTPSESGTMKLVIWVPLPSEVALTDTLILPPGYERMIAYELAEDLSLDYEVQLSQTFLMRALEAKAQAKRPNQKIPLLRTTLGLPGTARRSNILRDE